MSIRFIHVSIILFSLMKLSAGFMVTSEAFNYNWQCSALCEADDIVLHRACDHFDVAYATKGCETMKVHLVEDENDDEGIIENQNVLQCVLSNGTTIYVTKGDGNYPLLQWYEQIGWLYPLEFITYSPY